jgi:cysteine synthase A
MKSFAMRVPLKQKANQFENTANFRAHYSTTGPEIWGQARGDIDAFVMAAGTGGTLSGVGTYLREMKPEVQVCTVRVFDRNLHLRIPMFPRLFA